MVNKAQQTGFRFTQAVSTIAYAENATVSHTLVGGQGEGAITYRSDNNNVATVATNTGIVTLKGVGTATITATKAGDRNYHPSTASSYTLVVNKGEQTGFNFVQPSINLAYVANTTISNIAQGGQGNGAITYHIDSTNVAIIDENTGEVTLKGAGLAKITANKEGDKNYNAATAIVYTLQIDKGQQTGFKFAEDVLTVTLANTTISNIAQGGQATGTITYRIDNSNVAIIDENTGEVTLKSSGTAKITATKAGNKDYLPTSATYLLRVGVLTMTLGIKNIKFEWADFGADHYRLNSDLGNGGGFVDASTTGFVVVPNSTNIRQTTARADIVLHRYIPLVNGPQYLIEPCDSGNICNSSNTIGTSLSNEQLNQLIGYIKASNTGPNEQFGRSVSISGDGNTLVVGAIGEDSNAKGIGGDQGNNDANNSGAVYVFVRSSTETWKQQSYIKASNAEANDQFGYVVSISGDGNTLAVGARFEDSDAKGIGGEQEAGADNSGAVYVFTRSTVTATWSQQSYIKASNSGANDRFGNAVSLSDDGNTLAVGARFEDSNAKGIDGAQEAGADNSGAVYVFSRNSTGIWSQQSYIKASNSGAGDQFGFSVSLSTNGNSLVVGAIGEDSNAKGVGGDQDNTDANNSGVVYFFTRSSTGTWSQQAYIKASNSGAGDEFGYAVSISGDGNSLVVGATGEDSNAKGIDGAEEASADNSGAVYVFTRSSTGTWSQKSYIKASNTDEFDEFGFSVSLSDDGNTLAVSARFEDSNAEGIDGEQEAGADNSGAVYVFNRSSTGTWSQQAYVKASNTGAGDEFGNSVSLSADGNSLAVGAIKEDINAKGIGGAQDNDDGTAVDSGAVYLY